MFRFRKCEIGNVASVINWPIEKMTISRNRYAVTYLIVICVLLRRPATLSRRTNMEILFGKHGSQLPEIFWEGIERLVDTRGYCLKKGLSKTFIEKRGFMYDAAVYTKTKEHRNCVGCIDGTVTCIARPSGEMHQRVSYNGHKRKHSIKYQVVLVWTLLGTNT